MGDGSDADVRRASEFLAGRLPGWGETPPVAIVLGSGLGPLADRIAQPIRIPYGQIPGWHAPTVLGHKGELVVGTLGGRMVIAQSGRFHMYEGHSAAVAALPVRTYAGLGVTTLILTNAAGGIRRDLGPGTIMLIADHINLTGRTPLEGPVRSGEPRFSDMTIAYDADFQAMARRVAVQRGLKLGEGVYAGLLGPSFETPAEIRMLERIGADAVGMSTVVEVIAARALGLRCLGFSTITNAAAGLGTGTLSHLETMSVAGQTGETLGGLIEGVLRELDGPGLPRRPSPSSQPAPSRPW